jgi:hypothetical protein
VFTFITNFKAVGIKVNYAVLHILCTFEIWSLSLSLKERRQLKRKLHKFELHSWYCYVFRGVTEDGVWIGWMDLLPTCIHHSKLQVITAPMLIYTIHRSPQHPLSLIPARCVFNSRSVATASNNADSSSSRPHVDTVRRISRNCPLVNCQLKYSVICSQPPLQISTQLSTLD